jgi:ribonuclease Z
MWISSVTCPKGPFCGKRMQLLLLLVSVFVGCLWTPVLADSRFQGTYKGTFTGNFNGEWNCTVDGNGKIADWTISVASMIKGTGQIDENGDLTVNWSAPGRATIWTAKVTPDLKVVDGKLNMGGTFQGQGQKGQMQDASAKQAQPATKPDSPSAGNLKVVLLGTGTPVPNLDRGCAATLVIAGTKGFLIDSGRGVVNALVKAENPNIDAVLFTHYHSDHFGEIGELLVTRAIGGADKPLKIIGPSGARKTMNAILDAYSLDNGYRKAHHKEKWPGMPVDIQESSSGNVYDDGEVKITMFTVDHSPVDPAVAYRIDYKGRSVVVSGDTKKVAKMVEMAKGCDILVHEAANRQLVQMSITRLRTQNNIRAAVMSEEMMEYHTPTTEVAEIARDADVGKLVLTHLVPSIPVADQADQMFIQGMSDVYKGPIIVGRDGMVITPDNTAKP